MTYRKKMKIPKEAIVCGFAYLFTAVILTLIISFYLSINTPVSSEYRQTGIVISQGTNSRTVANILKKEGLIKKTGTFVYLSILMGKSGKLQAGEYRLSPDMTTLQILNIITQGKVVLYPVTIPEGYNMNEIAGLLNLSQLVNKKRFLSLTNEKSLMEYLDITGADNLEGYLFPDTYHLNKGIGEYGMLKKMVSTFKKNIPPEFSARAKEIGLTEHEVISLASLIEKETGAEEERELISAVFHNRLKKKMKLQCDPTVIYALQDRFDGNIRRKDLMFDSPYNTYRYYGLPPGPIANPGKNSIMAALYPADVDYLYFVSKKNGTHYFSKDFRTHNKAVRKYQLRR